MRKTILSIVTALAAVASTLVVLTGPAQAHGYISSPPSRQANCAQGRVANCGPIVYEPQSVEGPKGQRNCHGGLSQFAQLSDESKPWPATSVGQNVTFNWVLTARHATSTWEYFIGNTRVAVFNDGGRQPGATVSHNVNLGGFSGRQRLLAIWNIADTPMAFYSCVDLQIGGGGNPNPQPSPTPTVTPRPPSPTPTVTPPPAGGTWRTGTYYATGSTVTYGGATYRCLQAHTSLAGWEPPNVPALWARV